MVGQPFFKKLTIDDGLSSNFTIRACADRQGFLWIGTAEGLNRYDGKNIRQYTSQNTPLLRNSNIREVWCDGNNQLWFRTSSSVYSIDSARNIQELKVKFIAPDYGVRNFLFTHSKGVVLLGINNQYRKTESGTFERFGFPGDSVFLKRTFTDIAQLTKDIVAISASNEVFIVDYRSETILASFKIPGILNLARINEDELLVVTNGPDGFYKISVSQKKITDHYTNLKDQNGKPLPGNLFYAEGSFDGRVVFTSNGSGIYIFDPLKREFINYSNVPGNALSLSDNFKTYLSVDSSGYVFCSSPNGLEYFNLRENNDVKTRPFAYQFIKKDSIINDVKPGNFTFRYSPDVYTFYFSPGSFTLRNTPVEYMLMGLDKNWIRAEQGYVKYASLPPGKYIFRLRALHASNNWVYSGSNIEIKITQIWWRTWWFRILAAALAALSLWSILKRREKVILKKSNEKLKAQQLVSENLQQNLEMEKVISFFATSIGKKSSAEEILWDVAKNCISKLDFEDCVIYLLDEKGDHLVQKAAWGSKTTEENKILNPLIIPLGKGIVGHVAKTGKPEIINDTSADSRYIVDDISRSSEISVPLLIEGKVMGVIDSEHSQKNFFTPRHTQILSTIAALCANKIVLSRAEEEKKQAQLDLLELNQKMAEAKFMNLRLQMNPHFLFNSLSAIQHLIVSEQPRQAYKYLTVFSNLLRLVLQHADKNFITLDEEIKVVKMYLEIESLRFKDSFRYEITSDESLDHEEILIPSLLLQPFVENAIWHGLLNKEGEKKLDIHFTNIGDTHLRCEITDNGVGRKKAAEIKNKQTSAESFESKALQIIHDRLKLLEQKTGRLATVEITDLYVNDDPALAAGTKVVISIPFYFNADI